MGVTVPPVTVLAEYIGLVRTYGADHGKYPTYS